jgi:GntR family transcriptional regulator
VYLLNPNSGVPLYVQLQQQVQQRILTGQLADGVQLPSVRELSAQLGLNPLTVSKVYQLLEREGTYVSHQSPALRIEARRRQIEPALDQLVTEALHLGLSEKEIQSLLSDKFRHFKIKARPSHEK